ncbi:hypothetical protein ABE66_08920 [Cytobacillus firmus]|nr:hypothetical protein [Cytobacillus firmus]
MKKNNMHSKGSPNHRSFLFVCFSFHNCFLQQGPMVMKLPDKQFFRHMKEFFPANTNGGGEV